MSRRGAQLNIRSDKARQRVADLVAQTGKTAAQVVEEAVMAYRAPPPPEPPPLPAGFAYKNGIVVQTAKLGLSAEQHSNAVERAREDRDRHLLGMDDA